MIYSFGGDNDEYIERENPDHYYTVPGSRVRYAQYFGSGKLDNAITVSASHQKPLSEADHKYPAPGFLDRARYRRLWRGAPDVRP